MSRVDWWLHNEMRQDGALLTLNDWRWLGSVGDDRMLVAEISVKFGMIPPRDKETTSEAPSGDDGSPSGTEGRRKDAIALGNEGRSGGSGTVGKIGREGRDGRLVGRFGIDGRLVGRFGIDGNDRSCKVFSVSVSKVGTISSASTCLSRLEPTSDDQTSASKSLSE